jgi:hypothetical protein
MLQGRYASSLKSIRLSLFSVAVVGICGFSTPNAQADIWGASIAASIIGWVLDNLSVQIEGMLLGALKTAAMQVLNQQINRIVGGSSAGKALFITNYQTFLYQEPLQKTNLYMNDFFTLSTRGKGASANYISAGGSDGLGGNYSSYLVEAAKQATIGSSGQQAQMTLDQYTSSPQQMLQEGDWRAFNAFFSNPANNVFGYTIMAEQHYQSKLATEQTAAQTKAQSSGYLPSEKNGQIVAPSATIETLAGKVQGIGTDLLAASKNPGEIIASAVAAAAGQMINKMIQQGVGEVQSNIQKEVNSVKTEVGSAKDEALRNQGPGGQFSSSVAQRTNVSINPNTPAPPSASLVANACAAYGSSSSCQQQSNCSNGFTKGACVGGLVCCYNPPTSTGLAAGATCTSYGRTGSCQQQNNCHNGYTTSSCKDGLVCCYNP